MHSYRSCHEKFRPAAVAAACGAVFALVSACALVIPPPDVTIGTGNPGSSHDPLGKSICRLFNLDTKTNGKRCMVRPSDGPIANVDALRNGLIDVGILQSDVLADAMAGVGEFASHGPNTELRKLFAGHADAFTIVARRELGIRNAAALRGRRVNMGSPGSGERIAMERIMAALGVAESDFAEVRQLTHAEQYRALCANELDAIIYEVAHPNGLIQAVVSMCHGVLVDIRGPTIDAMLRKHPEYERNVIPGGTYRGDPDDVRTIGVRAVVVTTTGLSDDLAYKITKDVFQNVEDFRRLHPAFAMLSVADMINAADQAPIHSGALRYYRERGWLP